MNRKTFIYILCMAGISLIYAGCELPKGLKAKDENKNVPGKFDYSPSQDSTGSALLKWKEYFKDSNLTVLIDSALKNNQELNIFLQEINIANWEIRARKGEYLPFLDLNAGAGLEKVSRYTRPGAVEASDEIAPGQKFPDPLGDFMISANLSWQVDIWKKLRNAKKSAMYRYLGTIEGKNFLVTNLVAEIANTYYELLALDSQLDIVKKNIDIQSNALEIVKLEKISARVTELAVRRFEAEVFHTRSLQFDIQQNIVEAENRINFLVGRFPQPVKRTSQTFIDMPLLNVPAGIPSQLLQNRTDIKQAELQLTAAKLDIKVAKANFYPSLNISAGLGLQAFNPKYLVTAPESILLGLGGGLVAPLVNRNAIKAMYYTATSKQVQAAFNYERTILNAYIEVVNQMSNIGNLAKAYDLKSQQVLALTQSIDISTSLFRSAKADYMEVLLTQRDALTSKFELIETKKQQFNACVNIYQALGGGWQ